MDGIGKVVEGKFFELDGQYALTLLAGRRAAVKWVSEVVPVALLNEPNEWYFTNHVLTGYRAGTTT
jgi:hypothetical protein